MPRTKTGHAYHAHNPEGCFVLRAAVAAFWGKAWTRQHDPELAPISEKDLQIAAASAEAMAFVIVDHTDDDGLSVDGEWMSVCCFACMKAVTVTSDLELTALAHQSAGHRPAFVSVTLLESAIEVDNDSPMSSLQPTPGRFAKRGCHLMRWLLVEQILTVLANPGELPPTERSEMSSSIEQGLRFAVAMRGWDVGRPDTPHSSSWAVCCTTCGDGLFVLDEGDGPKITRGAV